ncbi:amino acid adenylation domain-containing protein [Streptomyces sp. NPDC059455]|uniref:non-ribosomal peptide synthetase n=1 Tax=Streptomyces sp. NPDC059455 TaxID=3346837 RepID=UPI0036AA1E47
MATTTGTPHCTVDGTRPPAASIHPMVPFRQVLPAPGRGCHALIARLPGSVQARQVHRGWEEAAQRWPALLRSPLWETSVPAPQNAPAARERARREALRPVLGARSPLRAVLLRYADGVADLVLVADHSRVPRVVLDQIADAVVTGSAPTATLPLPLPLPDEAAPPPARWAPVEWGLGDPNRARTVSARTLVLPRLAGHGIQTVAGAVALTLARYSGESAVRLGLIDADGDRYETAVVCVGDIDEEQSPADYLTQIDTALDTACGPEAGPGLPALGVVFSSGNGDRVHLPFQTPPFPLTIHVAERPDGSSEASCWFDEGAVCPPVAAMFCAGVERLTARLAGDAGEPTLSMIPLLAPEETARILRLGRDDVPPPGTGGVRIDQRFEEGARQWPDAVAVVDDEGELTYRQLQERADGVAAGLRAIGLAPASKVGVCLDRDASLVIALLGILKAGCAYVPMDRQYPPERLRYVVEDARLSVVITDPADFPAIGGVRAVPLTDLSAAGDRDRRAPRSPRTADVPAYVIYTSGSTGRPKGVVVPHRNVISLLDATAEECALGPDDVWTLFHSSAFDFSVWEIWGCLLTGGRLVVVPYWTARDADGFRGLLAEQRVTVLNQTPSAFVPLSQADRRAEGDLSVRLLIFGGESLDVRLLAPWFARYSPTRCRVVNMFGITETTVHATAHPVTPADVVTGSRTVGRALPGWSVSVRDPRGRVLPPGAAGEIHIGGAGLAEGYLGRPDLTAQRFVIDEETGERLYRSGDRGRLRPDGRLDHLGRLDDQVKIRGHRIELGEIRSVLAADPRVSAAVVTVRQASADDPASSRIDGYVVLAERCGTREILADTRRLLPDYMVPATLTEISSVPLTTNGKPDMARLPQPSSGPGGRSGGEEGAGDAPGPGGLAAEILGIWSRCLRTAAAPDDNFFELGGNSLLVLRVITAMREKGMPEISPRDFYINSNASRFIRLVEERRGGENRDES